MRITHEGDINAMFALCLGVGNTENFLITMKRGGGEKMFKCDQSVNSSSKQKIKFQEMFVTTNVNQVKCLQSTRKDS